MLIIQKMPHSHVFLKHERILILGVTARLTQVELSGNYLIYTLCITKKKTRTLLALPVQESRTITAKKNHTVFTVA